MKLSLASILLLLALIPATSVFGQNDFYTKRWSRVYRYELKSLPKSAVLVTDTIYARAKRDKNIPQLTKALIYQSKFALTLSENAELLITDKFKKEISETNAPLKNILESMLANIYWDYFKQNRWKYYQRTTIEKKEGNDFRLWDSQTMFNEIHTHFQNSLHQSKLLQGINLATINDILTEAENSRVYRPTLYDFIAHNAIDFYQTSEGYIAKAASGFEMDDPHYFNDFENLKLASDDSLAPEYQTLKLYKSLLAFHKADKDQSAFINNELERLQYIVDEGEMEGENELHKKALAKLKSTYQDHPASTLIDFQLASLLFKESGEFKASNGRENQSKKNEALTIVEKAIANFPKSDGAEQCKILRSEILKQHLEVSAERFLPAETPSRLLITYANLDSLTFYDYFIPEDSVNGFYQLLNNDSLRSVKLVLMRPEMVWKATLPNLKDYQQHSTEIVLPKLKRGNHFLLATTSGKLPGATDLFAYAPIQVTNLALIETSLDSKNRYQVVNRNTGAPIPGAKVTFKSESHVDSDTLFASFTSDKNGFVDFKRRGKYWYNTNATIEHEGDRATFGGYYIYQYYEPSANEGEELNAKVFLFSDRSIYRPGQTVFFKGILIKTKGKKSTVVANQYVEVTLEDANGQDIAELRLKSNSYGSFSGEFKLPAGGLTGEYTITADEDDDDSRFYDKIDDFEEARLGISVEEYKRPTFEVTFKPVKETFKLNDTIRVTGSALTFSGAKVSNAEVSYRVKRRVRYPSWHYWNRRNSYSGEQEIGEGELTSTTEGEFIIKFKSIPDEKVSKEELPVFIFEITADVTDVNGETRSATSTVKVGYQSMIASVNTPAILDRKKLEHSISVTTENLNGQPVPAKGTITLYKSKFPSAPQRTRPWSAPDQQQIGEEEFRKLFPHDPFSDNKDEQMQKGKQMIQLQFNTAVTGEVKFKTDKTWELGAYIIELETTDETGTKILARHKFDLFDASANTVADNKMLTCEADKSAYNIGDIAKIKIGSASKDITVAIDLVRSGRIEKTYVKHLSGNYIEIQIPITEKDVDALTVQYASINYNDFFHGSNSILVNAPQATMEIETISFKDKLQPGSKETWSFEIKHSDPLKKEAEVLASMYDASLDQFKSHSWQFDPIEREYGYDNVRVSADACMGTADFTINNNVYGYYEAPHLYFDQFDDFGFSITGNYRVQQNYFERIYALADAENHSKVTQLNDRSGKKGYVSGRITSIEDGSPLPGVNVVVKGTTNGTVTDEDGRYTLAISKGDVLVFSFIGFTTTETKVGKKNTVNVALGQDVMHLSEVVVTAQGVRQERKALGFSVMNVKTNMLNGEIVFEEPALEAVADSTKVADKAGGVMITGMPGGAKKLMLRGDFSFASKSPLYVVDGVVMESSKIDKDDIEAIQVLKGDAAVALYGSRAANGVIVITTKSGQKKLDEELAKVNARKNFNETAFFFPHLSTDENGRIQFTFTTPESLTRWKLQLLAHNRNLESATKTLNAVTQKDFMVTPNAPRFLRVGDEIQFSAKIVNLTTTELSGSAALQLTNAVTGESIDQLFQNLVRNQPFNVSAKGNSQVLWKIKVPSGIDAIQYKVVAKSGNFSDGEQNALPILSNRTLVTETLPMMVRGGETKTFSLEKLKNNTSSTLQNHQLTLEVTSNPAWYAVQALPYLMEFPHECSEQTFARYYSNTLASSFINSNPKIKEVFEKWSSSGALISNLEKNQDLKSTIIQETPWLRDAQSETEQKKRIALLFDLNTMKDQKQVALDKLKQLQLQDGGFTWFAGGRYSSRYITQHIASGFGHLRSLKVVNEKDPFMPTVEKAISYLDAEIARDYNRLIDESILIKSKAKSTAEGTRLAKEFLERDHIGSDQIHYLYMRSFFSEIKITDNVNLALTYYRNQSAQFWKSFPLYFKGMIALIHYRNKNGSLANDILKSLKENSIVSDEMGMYWKENKGGWYWSEAPIETQALIIEAFAEIESTDQSAKDKQKTIDDLRIWLLKNKQTNQWQTTKATTEAIYALLLNGTEWLTSNDKVEISVGNKKVVPPQQSVEAATGYFKTNWKANAVTPEMGKVKLTKKGDGVAWAGLYWQYFEDLDKIIPSETPLKLSKKVFVVSRTDKGELLTEINPASPIAIGSLLRIRIELKSDRDMQFLHMKDMRASGLEPVDVLSEYKWQDGLGYYQSTKDASTNFFFDSLHKGVYVFEYDLRVSNKGDFSNGITTIQCMYAPEFSSHSEGIRIKVE